MHRRGRLPPLLWDQSGYVVGEHASVDIAKGSFVTRDSVDEKFVPKGFFNRRVGAPPRTERDQRTCAGEKVQNSDGPGPRPVRFYVTNRSLPSTTTWRIAWIEKLKGAC